MLSSKLFHFCVRPSSSPFVVPLPFSPLPLLNILTEYLRVETGIVLSCTVAQRSLWCRCPARPVCLDVAAYGANSALVPQEKTGVDDHGKACLRFTYVLKPSVLHMVYIHARSKRHSNSIYTTPGLWPVYFPVAPRGRCESATPQSCERTPRRRDKEALASQKKQVFSQLTRTNEVVHNTPVLIS